MLTENELEEYFEKHRVSERAREYICLTRDSEPSRLIGTQAKSNVCTWFVSNKMGHTIQAESRTAELGYVLEFEYADDIFEYWDQLPPLSVTRTYKNGTRRRGPYTADFLVLGKDGPKVVEVKTQQEIDKKLKANPADWIRAEDEIIYRPANEVFAELGLNYGLYSTADLNPVRSTNLNFLLQARSRPDQLSSEIKAKLLGTLEANAWLTLAALAEAVGMTDYMPIFQAIVAGFLHVDIDRHLLSQPDSVKISSSPALLEIAKQHESTCDGNMPLPENGDVGLESVPTENQAKRALAILERIEKGENSRSIRRWKEKIRKGEEQGLSAFQSVLPRTHRSGNRTPRLHPKCVEFIRQFIDEHHATTRQLSESRSYALYKVLAEQHHPGIYPVSRPTFAKYLKMAGREKIAAGRGGKRAGNAAAEPTDVLHREIKATLPFEHASLDHYLLDQFCVIASANGENYVARPWLSALIDNFTSSALAVWLSFRSPCSRSCAMVIRQCVRNHGKLPKSITVDGGSEFISTYFHALLAHCGMNLVLRPKSHPRYGSEVERFFGEYKTQWLNLRPGNLANYNEARAVSSSHAPFNNAALTIEETLSELHDYIEWRNSTLLGARSESASILLPQGDKHYPFIGVPVELNDEFKVITAVDVNNYTVDATRGIHIGDFHYWHPSLAQQAPRKRPVTVRIEPENPYQIYALTGDQWITCRATGDQQFQTKSATSQQAEALRLLDGSKARKEAKNEADNGLIRKMLVSDKELAESKSAIAPAENVPESEHVYHSLFDDLHNAPVAEIEAEYWDD